MKAHFADSWFYIALLDETDQHHLRVAAFAADFRGRLVTARWVLAEVANALSGTATRSIVAAFLLDLETDADVAVIGSSDTLFNEGMALYAARPDKTWSLTDCISFVVMDREGLREALTGDRHFAQAGFVAVFAGEA